MNNTDNDATGIAERLELALAILRSPLVKVNKLEISTAENLAYIAPGKMKILREIYKVAKEDERLREAGDGELLPKRVENHANA